jgi:hypothetical protein
MVAELSELSAVRVDVSLCGAGRSLVAADDMRMSVTGCLPGD